MGLFETLRSTFTHPLVAGPLGGALVVLLAYLDAKYRKEEKMETSTYWKLFIVSSLVFATIIYFVSAEYNQTDEFLNQNYDTDLPSLLPSKDSLKLGGQPTMKRPDISESLLSGLPEPGNFKMPESNVSMKIRPAKSGGRSRGKRSVRRKR